MVQGVRTALLLLLNVFVLLTSYYVLKVIREPLILASGGAQLTYVAAMLAGGPARRTVPGWPATGPAAPAALHRA